MNTTIDPDPRTICPECGSSGKVEWTVQPRKKPNTEDSSWRQMEADPETAKVVFTPCGHVILWPESQQWRETSLA
jgi:hypothetical protein